MTFQQRLEEFRARRAKNLEGTEEVTHADLRKGDTIVLPDDGYRLRVEGVRRLMAASFSSDFDMIVTVTGEIRTFDHNTFRREPVHRLIRD